MKRSRIISYFTAKVSKYPITIISDSDNALFSKSGTRCPRYSTPSIKAILEWLNLKDLEKCYKHIYVKCKSKDGINEGEYQTFKDAMKAIKIFSAEARLDERSK